MTLVLNPASSLRCVLTALVREPAPGLSLKTRLWRCSLVEAGTGAGRAQRDRAGTHLLPRKSVDGIAAVLLYYRGCYELNLYQYIS